MSFDPKTIVQILVLTVGIHVVLSFLRTTRGSGLIRGVAVAMVVIFGGLLGVARFFDLNELDFIVESVSGFVVVILAIVFQPELRRGIVSIGENPLLRRVIGSRGADVVDEVAAACVAMAKRKQGALIAFERQNSLDPYAQTAARIDSRVQRDLLDTIFYTGSALHDGAVIIREGRIACAMAILPLSENDQLASSVGTRHRAALGLTEETDAVVVAVSEETGLISVFQGGQMERRVVRDELADVLRARLGGDDIAEPSKSKRPSPAARVLHALVANPGQKLMSLLLAVGLFVLAFRSVTTSETFGVEVRVEAGADARTTLSRGTLRFVLPSESLHVAAPAPATTFEIEVTAAHADFAEIAGGIGGVLQIEPGWIGTEVQVPADKITWGVEGARGNLDVRFKKPESLVLRIEEYGNAVVRPSIASFRPVEDGDTLEGLTPPAGKEVEPTSLEFNPPSVLLRGPKDEIARLAADPTQLHFEDITLEKESEFGFVERVRLERSAHPEIVLDGDLFLRGRLRQLEKLVTQVELDVALLSFDTEKAASPPPFDPPTATVTVLIKTRNLFPDSLDESTRIAMLTELLQFVRARGRVFVDVDAVDVNSNRASVEVGDLDPIWRSELTTFFLTAKDDPTASLRLEIDEADRTIVLTPRAPADDDDE
ncbi:MAG: diadenylate cyclase [Planctomycetota bacterium]